MELSGIWEAGAAFKFCPSCASPRVQSVEGREWICPDCGFEYFHNVATSATVIVDVEGSIALLKRAREPRRGFWALPGGFVEPAERAEDAAARECREELGWAPEWMEFLATFPNIYRYRDIPYATCDLYFYTWAGADDAAGFVADIGEAAEVASFPADAIPWDEIAFDSARSALRAYILARGRGFSLGHRRLSI
ncbi:MAG TPA: NUDIX domain-containing protein [Rectinemataceae bacterium]|nr:NUDIX domain-containing protein [Rectinemataceae bacterium]